MLNIIAIHVWWSSQLPLNTVDCAIASFAEVYEDQTERVLYVPSQEKVSDSACPALQGHFLLAAQSRQGSVLRLPLRSQCKVCDVCTCQRFSFDSRKFRHRQPVAQPTVTAGIMTSGRGGCILGVKTCQRCIEHLVFGLFDCGVGEFDRLSRMGLGSLGPFLRPVCLQICLVLV
jgi:hypothetical protein